MSEERVERSGLLERPSVVPNNFVNQSSCEGKQLGPRLGDVWRGQVKLCCQPDETIFCKENQPTYTSFRFFKIRYTLQVNLSSTVTLKMIRCTLVIKVMFQLWYEEEYLIQTL